MTLGDLLDMILEAQEDGILLDTQVAVLSGYPPDGPEDGPLSGTFSGVHGWQIRQNCDILHDGGICHLPFVVFLFAQPSERPCEASPPASDPAENT